MKLKLISYLYYFGLASCLRGSSNLEPVMNSAVVTNIQTPLSSVSKACPKSDICYSVQDFSDEVEFTIQCPSSVGWVAIGTGTQMKDSNIIVAWKNNDNTVTLSDRISEGHSMPQPVNNQSSKLMPQSRVEGDKMSIVFRRLKNTGNSQEVVIKEDMQEWIYAYSNAKPSSNLVNSTIKFHDGFGTMSLNLKAPLNSSTSNSTSSAATTETPPPKKKVNFYLVHGCLFFLGWNLIPYIGILAAGPMKPLLGVWWFRIHVGMMAFMAPILSIAGFVLIVIKNGNHHFQSLHEILGLIIFILQFIQIFSGVVIDRLYNPKRAKIPWYDKLHWYTGRVLFVLAQVNISLGFYVYDKSGLMNPVWALFGIVLFLEVFALFLVNFIVSKTKQC